MAFLMFTEMIQIEKVRQELNLHTMRDKCKIVADHINHQGFQLRIAKMIGLIQLILAPW